MPDPFIERIGNALHRTYDDLVHEPLPDRWINLIKRLNAEKEQREAVRLERGKRSH